QGCLPACHKDFMWQAGGMTKRSPRRSARRRIPHGACARCGRIMMYAGSPHCRLKEVEAVRNQPGAAKLVADPTNQRATLEPMQRRLEHSLSKPGPKLEHGGTGEGRFEQRERQALGFAVGQRW